MKRRFIGLVAALCMLMSFVPISSAADIVFEGEEKYCTFTLNSEGTLTFEGKNGVGIINDWAVSYYSDLYKHADEITSVVFGKDISSARNVDFASCHNLKSLNTGEISYIDSLMFDSCTSLENIYLGSGLSSMVENAFYDCSSLVSIDVSEENSNYTSQNGVLFNKDMTNLIICPPKNEISAYSIPDTVTNISPRAFYNASVTSLSIPQSVTSIADDSFYGCRELSDITISENNPSYIVENGILFPADKKTLILCPAKKNLSEYTVPDGVTAIGRSAFAYNDTLTNVTLPESVTDIGTKAFANCTNLDSINLPDTINNIGSGAFDETALTGDDKFVDNAVYIGKHLITVDKETIGDFTIKDGTLTVASDAFYFNENITNVTIPDSVTHIGENTFGSCSSLESVRLSENLTEIPERAFDGCESLSAIIIPDSVVSIGYGAFNTCTALESVTLSKNLTEIPERAFSFCNSLTDIVIPDGVISIGSSAFSPCSSLNEVTIPSSVTTIADKAFRICDITDIYYDGDLKSWSAIDIGDDNGSSFDEEYIHFNSDIKAVSFEYNAEDGTYVCNADLSDISENCTLVAALYNYDDLMVGIASKPVTPSDANTAVSLATTVDDTERANYAVFYLWDSFKDMSPMCYRKRSW